MAKYIGLISSDARGKVGGAVLSRSRSGTTIKARTAPKFPGSPAQVSSQASLANANLSWKSLDDDSRTTWMVYAASITWANSLGGTYSPTGQQLYTQAFINALYFSLTPPAVFPTSLVLPFTISSVYCTRRATELIMGITASIADSPWYFLCFGGRFVHASVNYTTTKGRTLLGAITDTEEFDVQDLYIGRFGQLPPVGTNVPVRIVPMSSNAFISGTIWNSAVVVEGYA